MVSEGNLSPPGPESCTIPWWTKRRAAPISGHPMSHFPEIPKIAYEGPKSRNPLAFKHYNPDELVEGKSMRDHMRFGAAYWHVMRNSLSDPFGGGTAVTPWDDLSDSVDNAKKRADVFFEFLDKIDIDYYCFHDRDIAPELNTSQASRRPPARSCCGAPPACSPTRATRRVPAPRRTPASSPTPRRR